MELEEMVKSVMGMVVSQAAKAWRSLPCDVQVWLSIPDLIQIGTRELLRYASRWDPERGAAWSTYAYRLLHDTYVNEVRRYYQPKYRPVIPWAEGTVEGSLFDQYDAYCAVYRGASLLLRGWLQWAIGVPVGMEGVPFATLPKRIPSDTSVLAEEMKRLCGKYGFTLHDAEKLKGDAHGEYLLNHENQDAVQFVPIAL